MLSFGAKPDWRTPGLKGRIQDGVYKGKLYTAMPLRVMTAVKGAAFAGAPLTVLFLWNSPADDFINNMIFGFGLVFLFITYPFFLCYDPGKRIKITEAYLIIGMRRFDLNACGRFWSWKSKYNRIDENVKFEYGNQEITIKIRNSMKHTEHILRDLNSAMAEVRAYTPHVASAPATQLDLRSANF